MLNCLLAVSFAALVQAAPTQVVAASRTDASLASSSRVDSVRALRAARRAQESFETTRRFNLPREYGIGSHHCDVRVGRWCVWNDDSNDRKAPPEAPRTTEARAQLLARLDTLSARIPGDEWIAAQRVRYLIEAKRFGDAVHAAERCTDAGSEYRCRAYAAVALHDSGAVTAADSAFTAALAAMPDSIRCKWADISLLIDDAIADRYHDADCAARREIETEFWRLTTPLYLRDNDFRNEFLARVTRTDMARDSRTPMGSPNEPAFRETALRYGYDTWFVRDDPPAGSMAEAPIAGYREGGSGFNFVPDYAVFMSPSTLAADDWELKLRSARTIYAPSYARRFLTLTRQQISLFRRGDSALIVAAYDVSDDTLFTRQPLEAGLFVVPVRDSMVLGAVHGNTTPNAEPRGVLTAMAPWAPVVVSLELLNVGTRSAARARIGLRPDGRSDGVGISDLVIFGPRSSDSLPRRLEDALTRSISSDHVNRNDLVGLFWETYGVGLTPEPLAVAISIEPIKAGFMRRAAERLHLATTLSPTKMEWTELSNREKGIVSRAVTLNLSQLEPGRYQIVLTVSSPHGLPLVAKREITLDR